MRRGTLTCRHRTFRLWYTSQPMRSASLKLDAPTGSTMNSCIASLLPVRQHTHTNGAVVDTNSSAVTVMTATGAHLHASRR